MHEASPLLFRAADSGGMGGVDVSAYGPSSSAVWGLVPGESPVRGWAAFPEGCFSFQTGSVPILSIARLAVVRSRRKSRSCAGRADMEAALPLLRLTGRGSCRRCVRPAFETFRARGVLSAIPDLSHRPSSLFLAIPGEWTVQFP